MRTDHDVEIMETMRRCGGSFVKALGAAAMLADYENLERIKIAFPHLWREYAEIARLRAEREA